VSTVQLRMSGELADINRVLAALAAAGIEVASNGRAYPNLGSFGVRLYAEARPAGADPVAPVTATAERVQPEPDPLQPLRRARDRRALPPGGDR
jgi:hypothetical protein